jgi:hypothetical protein
MPSPLATWLSDHGGAFTQQGIYSYNTNGERFYYYTPPVTLQILQSFLHNNPYASPYLASSYILGRKPITLQNAIHYTAAGNLFERDTNIDNEFSLTPEQFPQTLCYQLQNNDDNDIAEKQLTAAQINAFVTNHNTLNPKTVIETIAEESHAILKDLLSYINSEDKKIKLFTTLDGDFNTILMSAFNGTLPYQAFTPLLDFVQANKDLMDFDVAALALQRNSLGSNIFHVMTNKVAGFCAEIFGERILLKAFVTHDFLGYTPLHHVCESVTEHKLAEVKFICNFLSGTTHEQALAKAFALSKTGYTPLHLLCISASATDVLVIDFLRQELTFLFKQQLEHADHLGNLPSHYAIKANNTTLLKSLLAGLDSAEGSKMLLQSNKAGATGLDSAVKFSDAAMVEYIIGVIGFDQFYVYCKTHTALAQLAEENKELAGKFTDIIYRHTVLYDCTAYFLKLNTPTEPTYLIRLNDFRTCLEHISQQYVHLPPALPDLQFDSSWFFFKTTNEYYELRKHIKTNMQTQLQACKTYFYKLYPDGDSHVIITSLFGNIRRASITTSAPSPSLHNQPALAKA